MQSPQVVSYLGRFWECTLYCLRSTHDCLCTLLGKTRFSRRFGFGFFGDRDESVLGFLRFVAVPCEVPGLVAVVAICVLGLEPINLHGVDLLDLFLFGLVGVIWSWFESSSGRVAVFPGLSAPGNSIECDGVVSIPGVRTWDESAGVYFVYEVILESSFTL